jgi:hypothetical protein
MKKIIFSLSLSLYYTVSLAQVTTLPNSIGIGQNTNAAIPLHIKKNGEVARLEGTWPYISFYDGITMNGYIQGIYPTFEIGTKNNFNLNFFTGNAQRLSIDGTNGQVTASQKINANGGLKLTGPLQAQGESVGADGMVLVSKGNATPAWEDQKIGFSANSPILNIPTNSETFFSGFSILFNDGNDFDAGLGEFTVPSSGLYSFHIKCKIGIPPVNLNNVAGIIKIIKNGVELQQVQKIYSILTTGYSNSLESTFNIKVSTNDIISFSFFHSSGPGNNLNVNAEISGYKIY